MTTFITTFQNFGKRKSTDTSVSVEEDCTCDFPPKVITEISDKMYPGISIASNLIDQFFGLPVSLSVIDTPETISKMVIEKILSDAGFLYVPSDDLTALFTILLTEDRAKTMAKVAREIKSSLNGDAFITLRVPGELDPDNPDLDFIVRQKHYTHNLIDVLADTAQKYGLDWLMIATDYKKP